MTFYALRKIMDLLLIEAQSNLDLLKEMGVIKLTVGYCTVWDARKRYEVSFNQNDCNLITFY